MMRFSATALSGLWALPFFSFLLGYYCLSWSSHRSHIQTPAVLGLPLQEAIKLLSTYQLNVRILKEKEDPDMPEGIIVSQSPDSDSKIKPYQSVFLVITRKPAKKEVPSLYGLSLSKAGLLAQEKAMPCKAYYLDSTQPQDTCIAQMPTPKLLLHNPSLITYISQGMSSIRIVPSFKGRSLDLVTAFLKECAIPYHIFYQTDEQKADQPEQLKIVDQRPLAGSFIDFKRAPTVQLTVA
jgi:eukaryotic-like serine/threonine-protein kinase